MEYISTRGAAPAADFETVLLTGLAPDGGLYMPGVWPQITAGEIAGFRDQPYAEAAAAVLSRFTGDGFSRAQLLEITHDVYDGFSTSATAPLTNAGPEDWILELFHGPTLAFKDFAMQILGRLFDDVLSRRDERLTVLAATSGDTGAAAIDALKACRHVDIIVLHPEGRVTDVQRRMMTTIAAPNVKNIAVAGDFDGCQAIVKTLFSDRDFVSDVRLSGVNSINWARLAAQIVYYFTAAASLGADKPLNFVVPTGNFGDVFAGYGAKKMGLPIAKLVVATNANDILHRALTCGDYTPAAVAPTVSPSMDIQIASNFERLLFEVMDRDADALRMRMESFATTRSMQLNADERAAIAEDFLSFTTSQADTLSEISGYYKETGLLIDPHTAVARHAARALRDAGALTGDVVTLSTAHPAKFPDAVKQACGVYPDLPAAHGALFEREEIMTQSPASSDAIKAIIKDHIRNKAPQ